MHILRSPIRTGDRVFVRRQPWRVLSVRAFERCQVVALAGAGPGNVGVERHVLTPFDTVEVRTTDGLQRRISRGAWRRACRLAVGSTAPSGALHRAGHASIDLLPHQLAPALAVVNGTASRLLIADEVGLGKTIQAGLILAELAARGAADRVLVLTPPGLRDQWAAELRGRFGLDPAVLDMRELRRLASSLPPGVNPWTTVPLAIASLDYVKRPEVLPAAQRCRWDVVVMDEAHTAASANDRHNAASQLCELAATVVLLTATPHNGDPAAFQSLCRLGSHGPADRLMVFRRTHREVALCPGRRVHTLGVRMSQAEARMHAELAALTSTVRRNRARASGSSRAAGAPNTDAHVLLVLAMLHKRAFSSAHSLAQSLVRRLAVLGDAAARGPNAAQLPLPLVLAGEADDGDLPPAWESPLVDDVHTEWRLLTKVLEAAQTAAKHERKLAALGRLLRRLARRGERAIVFTEYRDTLLRVARSVAMPAAVLHGGLTRYERRSALERFVRGEVTVLLATDAAGEGLNLQHDCRIVINLELPWNPLRLEQRIGRVDRIGQRRVVHAFHLTAAATGECRVLERLRARIECARGQIGAADPLALRPPESEASVSRWVIDGVAAPDADPVLAAEAGMQVSAIVADVDVAREQARLIGVRAIAAAIGRDHQRRTARSAIEALNGTTLLTRTRRLGTRAALRGRTLSVAQTVWTDGVGRTAASALTGALHRGVEPWEIHHQLTPGRDRASEATAAHQRFWRARQQREERIRDLILERTAASRSLQPGLFDHRAEHQHTGAHADLIEALHEAERRVEAARRSSIVSDGDTRVALVLEP